MATATATKSGKKQTATKKSAADDMREGIEAVDTNDVMGNFGEKVKAAIKYGKNVLIYGKHGIGKTSTVLEAIIQAGLRYRYFSVPTMEPWVDFIGIPMRKMGENGKEYLDLVRPREFAEDEVEVLVFDEVNRGDAKIRNAIMELIQFKSINGRKYNNLKLIIGMANPDNDIENYDTDRLDKAFVDRYHVKIHLPDSINIKYFEKKYNTFAAECAANFYTTLNDQAKLTVSPRTIDDALDVYFHCPGLTLADVLPQESNPDALEQMLKQGGVVVKWSSIFEMYRYNNAEPRPDVYDLLEGYGNTLDDDTNFHKHMQWMCKDYDQFRWGIWFVLHETVNRREDFAAYWAKAVNNKWANDREREMLEKLKEYLIKAGDEVKAHGPNQTYFDIENFLKDFDGKKYKAAK